MGTKKAVSAAQAAPPKIRDFTVKTFVDQTVVGKTPERLRGSN
jgi:hypothetical protein